MVQLAAAMAPTVTGGTLKAFENILFKNPAPELVGDYLGSCKDGTHGLGGEPVNLPEPHTRKRTTPIAAANMAGP